MQVTKQFNLYPYVRGLYRAYYRLWRDTGASTKDSCRQADLLTCAFRHRVLRESEEGRASTRAHNVKYAGITADRDLLEIIRLQGTCDICYAEAHGRNGHIDHDHVTGKVRGILCSRCNKGLGLL